MSTTVKCMDQTLYEALLCRLPGDGIMHMTEMLEKLHVECLDIPFEQARQYPFIASLPTEKVRAKIRPVPEELELAFRLGFRRVVIAWKIQPGENSFIHQLPVLFNNQASDMEVSICLENASTFLIEDIEAVWKGLSVMPFASFIYSDGDSLLDPFSTLERLRRLQRSAPFALEFHGHDAYGMATANTLSAISAGISHVATAVAGMGTHGHAPFEEVFMAARHLLNVPGVVVEPGISSACAEITCCFGRSVSVDKAIIGSNIFAHESGLHINGVVKNPKLYEAFSPEEVGLSRHMVIGKHSGSTSLRVLLETRGVELDDVKLQRLLKAVRKKVIEQKRSLGDSEVMALYLTGEWGS